MGSCEWCLEASVCCVAAPWPTKCIGRPSTAGRAEAAWLAACGCLLPPGRACLTAVSGLPLASPAKQNRLLKAGFPRKRAAANSAAQSQFDKHAIDFGSGGHLLNTPRNLPPGRELWPVQSCAALWCSGFSSLLCAAAISTPAFDSPSASGGRCCKYTCSACPAALA